MARRQKRRPLARLLLATRWLERVAGYVERGGWAVLRGLVPWLVLLSILGVLPWVALAPAAGGHVWQVIQGRRALPPWDGRGQAQLAAALSPEQALAQSDRLAAPPGR